MVSARDNTAEPGHETWITLLSFPIPPRTGGCGWVTLPCAESTMVTREELRPSVICPVRLLSATVKYFAVCGDGLRRSRTGMLRTSSFVPKVGVPAAV